MTPSCRRRDGDSNSAGDFKTRFKVGSTNVDAYMVPETINSGSTVLATQLVSMPDHHFRSCEALNVATLESLGDVLAERIGGLRSAPIATVDDVGAVFGVHLAAALGPGRVATGALVALISEAAVDPSLRPVTIRINRLWAVTIADMLRSVDVTQDVDARARWLPFYVTGLLVDQLAMADDDFDPVAAMTAALCGFGS